MCIYIQINSSIPHISHYLIFEMEKRTWLFIIVWHVMMSCVCARNMHFSHSHVLLDKGQILQSPQSPSAMQEELGSRAKEEEEVLSRLGSRPPRCEHKCKGCAPCSPIQVPTAHFGPQYTNYEPEGWRCKCGSILFNP